jgi:hypothetical protein
MTDWISLAILAGLFALTIAMVEGVNRVRGGRPK